MSAKTNSNFRLIPPTRVSVSAGSCIFSSGENPEVFLFLLEGELKAILQTKNSERELFRICPGEVACVPCLLEKEPLPYALFAEKDSTYLKVDEESLSSALRCSPVWFLAAIRNMAAKVKRLKEFRQGFLNIDRIRALVCFLQLQAEIKEESGETPIFEDYEILLRECSFVSRIPYRELESGLFSLERRHIVLLHRRELGIPDTVLLSGLADFLTAIERGETFPPFSLNLTEKRAIHCISRDETQVHEAGEWLRILRRNDKFATVAEVILLENLGLLERGEFGILTVNAAKVRKYLVCLKYETEIKGCLL